MISGVFIAKRKFHTRTVVGGVDLTKITNGVQAQFQVLIKESGHYRDVTHISKVWFKLYGARVSNPRDGFGEDWEVLSTQSFDPASVRTGTPTSQGGEGYWYTHSWTSFPSGIKIVKAQCTVSSSDPQNVDWWWPDATAVSERQPTPEAEQQEAEKYAAPNAPTGASATREGDSAIVTCSVSVNLATNDIWLERQLDTADAPWIKVYSATPAATVSYTDSDGLRGHRARYRYITRNLRTLAQSEPSTTDWVTMRPATIGRVVKARATAVSGAEGTVELTLDVRGYTGDKVSVDYHDGGGFIPGVMSTAEFPRESGHDIPNPVAVTGLSTAKRWYFRARVVGDGDLGDSGYTDVVSCLLATDPSAPQVSRLLTAYTNGSTVTLAWQHASADGAEQQSYKIAMTRDGTTTYIEPDSSHSPTAQQRAIALSGFDDGDVCSLKVQTRTFEGMWSAWSEEQSFYVYSAPNANIYLKAGDGTTTVDSSNPLTSLPLHVLTVADSFASGNEPIWWRVTVKAAAPYATTGPDGSVVNIAEGQSLVDWSISSGDPSFPSGRLHVEIGATAMTFEPAQAYTVTAECATEAGLRSVSEPVTFSVELEGGMVSPNASFEWHADSMRVDVHPVCVWFDEENDEPVYREDTVLAVYRVSQDGTTHLIASGLPNGGTTCSDPHADFGTCMYRVIATDTTNGMVASVDRTIETPFDKCCILWDETSQTFNEWGEPAPYMGQAVIAPYELEYKESYEMDVALSEHAGADFPIEKFGTMRNHELDVKLLSLYDDEISQGVRRLAGHRGRCYVRFPGVSGFPAVASVDNIGGESKYIDEVSVKFTRVKDERGDADAGGGVVVA